MNQTKELPRGLRNNNPLNIRKSSTAWQGKVENGTDPDFEQFSDVFYGCRAALVNLRTHIQQDKHRLIRTTVEREIARWAPPNENDLKAYVKYVCDLVLMKPNDVLDFSKPNIICPFLCAMARFENGGSADVKYHWFERAYEML